MSDGSGGGEGGVRSMTVERCSRAAEDQNNVTSSDHDDVI